LVEQNRQPDGPVELGAHIRMVHGDEVIASNDKASFEQMADSYAKWLLAQEP
jgi:hypothetical protein